MEIVEIESYKKKQDKKEKAIEFMKSLIQDLESDNLNPEKIVVFLKWQSSDNSEDFEFYDNIESTENILGMVELLRNKILTDYLL